MKTLLFKDYFRTINIALISLVLLSSAACFDKKNKTDQKPLQNSVSSIKMPNEIEAASLPDGTLSAVIIVDDVNSYDMTANGDAYSVTIGELQPGDHKFTVQFGFVSDVYGNNAVILATQSQTVNVSVDQPNNLTFDAAQYDTSFDDDNDSYTNLQEVDKEGHPFDANVIPDLIAPTANRVSPTNRALIRNDTPIRIEFSEQININSVSATGSLWDASNSGVWSATTVDDDTLVLSPATVWSEGEISIVLNLDDMVGNSIAPVSLRYDVDATLPVASVSPTNPGVLGITTQVIITFSESINTASLMASGTLWDESDKGVWSTSTNTNDTLTLSPTIGLGVWTVGDAKTLILNVNDLAGNPLSQLDTTFSVGCDQGFSACNGACIDLSSDANNCGSCGSVCASVANSSSVMCSSGSCSVASCNSGFTDCDNNFSNGCEVNTNADENNCGACGSVCGDQLSCTADSCNSGNCELVPNDNQCQDSNNCTFNETCNTTLGCQVENQQTGFVCEPATCGAWTCGGFASTCDVTGQQSRTCTPRVCDGAGTCGNGDPYTELGATCSRVTNGNACGLSCSAWSACGYSNVCDESGNRTRTCTPSVCDAAGSCVPGTPFVQSDPAGCSRNTDGNTCGVNRICIVGICENINL